MIVSKSHADALSSGPGSSSRAVRRAAQIPAAPSISTTSRSKGEFIDRGKSMFQHAQPVHLQTFQPARRPGCARSKRMASPSPSCAVARRPVSSRSRSVAADAPGDNWERNERTANGPRRRSAYRAAKRHGDPARPRAPWRAPFERDWERGSWSAACPRGWPGAPRTARCESIASRPIPGSP